MKKILLLFIVLSFLSCFFIQRRLIKKNNKIKADIELISKQNDSLKSEIFVKDIQIGRYEYIMGRAEAEMSPDCKEELEAILKQTE